MVFGFLFVSVIFIPKNIKKVTSRVISLEDFGEKIEFESKNIKYNSLNHERMKRNIQD